MNDLGHRQFDKKFSQREHTLDQLETAIRCLACVVAVALALALMGVFSYGCAVRPQTTAAASCVWNCQCVPTRPTVVQTGSCNLASYQKWCDALCHTQ